MATSVSPSDVLRRGLILVGFDVDRQARVQRSTNMRRFAAHFGSSPVVYATMWKDLQTTSIPEAQVDATLTALEHFLIAVHFLKCYPKALEAEGLFQMSERTVRKWVWFYLSKLQALKAEKIAWPSNWSNGDNGVDRQEETTFTVSVDGVHCRIHEPKHDRYSKNPAFYSHKFKQAGLGYEVALSIFENKVVWINGPFAAGKNDVSIFRAGLKNKMVEGAQLGIADKGYRGESNLLSFPSSLDDEPVRLFKSRALARQENFNGRMKNFECIAGVFRHHGATAQEMFEKHNMCFLAVAVICQYQMENGSPLLVV